MKAITLLRPWGMAIMRHGKDIENRKWRAPASLIGQRIAIHNGHKVDERGIARVLEILRGQRTVFAMDINDLLGPPGAIVGTVKLVGIVQHSSSLWFEGPWGWPIVDPRSCNPIICRGQQRLWEVPPEIEEMMRATM